METLISLEPLEKRITLALGFDGMWECDSEERI